MHSETRVMVTAIGSASAECVIQSLKRNSFFVVGTDTHTKNQIANSSMVDSFHQSPASSNYDVYISWLLDLCKSEGVEFIIPLTDLEIDALNKRRDLFDNNNITLCMSSPDAIHNCRNKELSSAKLQQETSVNLIPVITRDNIRSIDFPVICKPKNGRSSEDVKIVRSNTEMEEIILNDSAGRYLFQPFLEGTIVTVDIIRNRKYNEFAAIPRRETMRSHNGLGLAVSTFYNEKLINDCRAIAECLDITGCVNIEFIETRNNEFLFMECNPRFSGGIAFSYLQGYDFVINHFNCFVLKHIEPQINIRPRCFAFKYRAFCVE